MSKGRLLWEFYPHIYPLTALCGYIFDRPYLFFSLFILLLLLWLVLDFVLKKDESFSYDEVIVTPENDGRMSPWIFEFAIGSYLVIYVILLGYSLYYVQFKEPFIGWLLYAFPVGVCSASTFNLCHELIHKNTTFEKIIARFFLSLHAYSTYEYEHLHVHHDNEFTCLEEDAGTAKLNQSIYEWIPLVMHSAYKNAWKMQREFCQKGGYSFWNLWKNTLLKWTLFTVVFLVSISVFLGLKALLFYVIAMYFSHSSVHLIAYNQHYGLVRRTRKDGTKEPFTFMNVWSSDHFITSRYTVNVSHHGHHHLFSFCRYPHLKILKKGPLLPYGYYAIYFISLFPKWWYKVMNPRVAEVFRLRDEFESKGDA